METALIFGLFAIVAIALRLMAGSIDSGRIENYIRLKGWELVDRSWDPLGPGWFGERSDRIYEIVYRDGEGNLHRAHVKTSMFTGVYLTNDEIVERPRKPPKKLEGEALREENERLKARVEALERKSRRGNSSSG